MKSKRTAVICQACNVTVLAEEVPAHSNSPEHQAKVGGFRMKVAIKKVTGWDCPGPTVPMSRPLALVE